MRSVRLGLVLGMLVLAALACALPGGPQPPASPIPVSTEAAGQLVQTVKTAVAQAAETGQVDLTLTEAQITSYAALKLAEQADPPLTDLQIYLRDGKVQVFGTAQAGQVSAPVIILLTATISAEGQLQFGIERADFGPLPVPDALLDQITSALDDAITEQAGGRVTVADFTIVDGQLTLTGTLSK